MRRLNNVKMSFLLKLIYRSNAISNKIPVICFVDIDKLILKFICRDKRLRNGNTILKEKNKVGGLTLPNFKTYYKATTTKAV